MAVVRANPEVNAESWTVLNVWYQSFTEKGSLWCETSDYEDFCTQNSYYSNPDQLRTYKIPVYRVDGVREELKSC